jgi:signal transduction histidine kinase
VPPIWTRPDWPLISGLALTAVALVEAYTYSNSMFVALGSTLPLIMRRTHLVAAAAIMLAATFVAVTSDGIGETVAGLAAQVWVLYLLAERFRSAVALAFGAVVVGITLSDGDPGIVNVALLVGGIGALAVGNSRRLGGQVEEARHDQAVLAERARIARELHDVVAHHVSTIAIQADTARLATPGMPAEGAAKLEAIGDTARDAMIEMRRILGVLRSESGQREPQPGLDSLGELIEAARSAGTPVRLVLEGTVAPLGPGVELTAYRLVQEALTNARRHAPGASVEVALHYEPDALLVRVRDDGPGPAGDGPGLGLIGMRERVATVGGQLTAGPADGGGFLVDARLPLSRAGRHDD